MRRLARASAVALVFLLCAFECGGDDIGAPCASDAECTSREDATCAASGVCTYACTLHSDCGCLEGTTDADIADGRCGAGCQEGRCVRVCTDDHACLGEARCTEASGWAGCQ